MSKDYYEILGVYKSSSSAEIKRSYRKLAMKYHPDKNPGDKISEKSFKEITKAYEVLKDPQKKAVYDQYGHTAFEQSGDGFARGSSNEGSGFSDFEDIFSNFSDIFGGGRSRKRSSQIDGSDIRYNISVDLLEAFNGVSKNIKFKVATTCDGCKGSGSKNNSGSSSCTTCNGAGKVRMQQGLFIVERTCSSCNGAGQIIKDPCMKCHGQGRVDKEKNLSVKIPAGVDDGNRIRLSGEGEAGSRGGANGDLYVFISVENHDFFNRQDNDIFVEVPIKMTTAALGGSIEIPSIEGSKAKLTIPSGTQTNNKFRLKNKGMNILNSGGRRGDMYVQIFVETPVNLNNEQQELLTQLDNSIKEKSNPKSQNFFKKFKDLFS